LVIKGQMSQHTQDSELAPSTQRSLWELETSWENIPAREPAVSPQLYHGMMGEGRAGIGLSPGGRWRQCRKAQTFFLGFWITTSPIILFK
jgi:hypothetical protein